MKPKARSEHERYIGERIREARIAANLSQTDLADMMGVSYQQVQKYELGQSRMSSFRMGRLMTALNRPFSWFVPGQSQIKAAPELSSMMADKYGQRIAVAWPQIPPKRQKLMAEMAEEFAA